MPRTILWPRHEVFDLVIPALSQCGRALSQGTIMDVIKHLIRVQSPDHLISFDRWVVVAKETLKWNDACIRLFWDMLHVATSSQSHEPYRRHSEAILLDYVSLFLILHIPDTVGRPTSPAAAYETVWPTADMEMASPPTSPIRTGRRISLSGSPKSPRNSTNNVPASPKRSGLHTSRQARSATQILNTLRPKMVLLLRAVGSEECGLNADSLRVLDFDSGATGLMSTGELMLSRRAINSLSFFLGGGYTRDSEVTPLSALCPIRASLVLGDNIMASPSNSSAEHTPCYAFSDIFSWIDVSLCSNELIYPSSFPAQFGSPNYHMTDMSDLSDSALLGLGSGGGSNSNSGLSDSNSSASVTPLRNIVPLATLSAFKPITLTGFSSTIIHLATSTSAAVKNHNQTSLGAGVGGDGDDMMQRRWNESGDAVGESDAYLGVKAGGGVGGNGDGASATSGSGPLSVAEGEARRGSDVKNGVSLPHLNLQGCSRASMYFLQPFASAIIVGCTDCTIVLPAIGGAVLLSGCERVAITVACVKLVVRNCLDCDVRLAVLTSTVVYGDSRGLSIAPFNCSYRQQRAHMQWARLQALHNAASNVWSSVCDVSACVETPPPTCSPSGYALDLIGEGEGMPLPTPPESTCTTLHHDKFFFVTVPMREQHLPAELCAIPLPLEYATAITAARRLHQELQSSVTAALLPADHETPAGSASEPLGEVSAIISKQFMDWLVASGKAQHLLDLVRLDSEASVVRGSGK